MANADVYHTLMKVARETSIKDAFREAKATEELMSERWANDPDRDARRRHSKAAADAYAVMVRLRLYRLANPGAQRLGS